MLEGCDLDRAIDEVARAARQNLGTIEHRVDDLSKTVDYLAQALSSALDESKTESSARVAIRSALHIVDSRTAPLLEEAKRLVAERKKTLSHIRICIFGRTGAGKSTLAEALIHGRGSSVSPGRCGFTETCRESVATGANLIVVDTPGIEVFGKARRDEHESMAREAVRCADLVLLVFSSSSQLEGELRKIREWVLEFGKPVLAVLNVMEPRWRNEPAHHDRLTRDVRQQADRIRRFLSQNGFDDVPLVAVHLQRALFARSGGSYAGPSPGSRRRLLEKHGKQPLLEISGFTVLERLIAKGLELGAAELRVQALHGEIVGVASLMRQQLAPALEALQEQNDRIREELRSCFDLVGSPAALASRERNGSCQGELELLRVLLEDVDEGRNGGARSGGLQEIFQRFADSEVASLHGRWLETLDAAVIEAYEEEYTFDGGTLEKTRFDENDFERLEASLEAALSVRVLEGFPLCEIDWDPQHFTRSRYFETITGRKGVDQRLLGRAMRGLGALCGAVACTDWLLAFPAMGIHYVGSRIQKSSSACREQSRAANLAAGRETIAAIFDEYLFHLEQSLGDVENTIIRAEVLPRTEEVSVVTMAMLSVEESLAATNELCTFAFAKTSGKRALQDAVGRVAGHDGASGLTPSFTNTVLLNEIWPVKEQAVRFARGVSENAPVERHSP